MTMRIGRLTTISVAAGAIMAAAWIAAPATVSQSLAAEPGKGIEIQPITTGRPDHRLTYEAVFIGLERLGYKIKEMKVADFPVQFVAIAQGDADFMAIGDEFLHKGFYEKAGGDKKLIWLGPTISGALQGYFVDMATSKKHGVTKLEQMKDPKIAKLFDTDGDGKANLTGCNPGWGCERTIEHHMDAYKLRDHVNHDKGAYFALMADTLARLQEGKPIFFYMWSPSWTNFHLRVGDNVELLSVPFSSLPDKAEVDTTLPDGRNPGFETIDSEIAANRAWTKKNPAAATFLDLFRYPMAENAKGLIRIQNGEKTPEQIRAIAEQYVKSIQPQFDAWIAAAEKAGS